jgi:hypothetical protein
MISIYSCVCFKQTAKEFWLFDKDALNLPPSKELLGLVERLNHAHARRMRFLLPGLNKVLFRIERSAEEDFMQCAQLSWKYHPAY